MTLFHTKKMLIGEQNCLFLHRKVVLIPVSCAPFQEEREKQWEGERGGRDPTQRENILPVTKVLPSRYRIQYFLSLRTSKLLSCSVEFSCLAFLSSWPFFRYSQKKRTRIRRKEKPDIALRSCQDQSSEEAFFEPSAQRPDTVQCFWCLVQSERSGRCIPLESGSKDGEWTRWAILNSKKNYVYLWASTAHPPNPQRTPCPFL